MVTLNCGTWKFRFLCMVISALSICLLYGSLISFELKTSPPRQMVRYLLRNVFQNQLSFKPNEANFTYRGLKKIPGFGNAIQLFSAIVGNSTSNSTWDRIFINGWDLKRKQGNILFCCISYSSGPVKSFPVLYTQTVFATGVEFTCEINDGGDARKATVSKTDRCHANLSQYVSVEHPSRHSEEIAIFAKVIYGNISAIDLITWFEIHSLFDFQKVYIYPYSDLNRSVKKVLHFYINRGLFEVIPYTTPKRETKASKGYFNTKNHFAWANKQISLYDGYARLKGYKYVMCFDPDEFIIPRKEKSYMDFFDRLFKEHPNAAGFYFHTYLYIKDWGATDPNSLFDIDRYRNRTELTRDRVKHAFIPYRLESNRGFQVHNIYEAKGYKSYDLPEEEAATHHYRKCRREFLKPKTKFPCYKVKRFHDDTMSYYLQKVQDKILKIAAQLEI